MTEEGEAELVDLLSETIDEIEAIEDGQFTGFFRLSNRFERWANQTEDTSTLDKHVEFGFLFLF